MQMTPSGMPALLKTEFSHAVWRAVREYAEARIDELRQQNDAVGLPEAQTNAIRGGISELLALLAQDAPPMVVPHRNIYLNRSDKD